MCCFGIHYLIWLNTSHEVIKASSPLFCHIIMVGGDIAVLMCGLSALSNELQCRLVPTLTAIAFSTIFGALLAKTYVWHFFLFVMFCLLACAHPIFALVLGLCVAYSQNLQF